MEERRLPNRFSEQGHPLSSNFYSCGTEIKFYGVKSPFEGKEPMKADHIPNLHSLNFTTTRKDREWKEKKKKQ